MTNFSALSATSSIPDPEGSHDHLDLVHLLLHNALDQAVDVLRPRKKWLMLLLCLLLLLLLLLLLQGRGSRR